MLRATLTIIAVVRCKKIQPVWPRDFHSSCFSTSFNASFIFQYCTIEFYFQKTPTPVAQCCVYSNMTFLVDEFKNFMNFNYLGSFFPALSKISPPSTNNTVSHVIRVERSKMSGNSLFCQTDKKCILTSEYRFQLIKLIMYFS